MTDISFEDPRQFVPPSGQSWTSLDEIQRTYQNKWRQDAKDPRVWSIWTEPKVCSLVKQGFRILIDVALGLNTSFLKVRNRPTSFHPTA